MSWHDHGKGRYSGELRFDYYQFYLGDSVSDPGAFAVVCWDDPAAVERGLAVSPTMVVLRTEDVGTAFIELELHHRRSDDDIAHWDYVIEASLGLPSGHLVIDGYSPALDFESPPPVPVAPGAYRVRVYHNYWWRDDDSDDRYRIVLWPAAPAEVTVLRRVTLDAVG